MKRFNERGASAIEFALLLPLLLLILMGTVEFGLLLYDQQIITNASREGARHGIKNEDGSYYTLSDIQTVVNTYVYPDYPTLSPSRLVNLKTTAVPTVTLGTSTCSSFGANLEVDVSYQYSFLVLGFFGITNPLLAAKTVMKCE